MRRTPAREQTLADLGESALIRRIARRAGHRSAGSNSSAQRNDRAWPRRIGDDAAILRPRDGEDLVVSTDAQVEGVHFRFGREAPRTIGRRALAVNLSDLAAMGAQPVGSLLSLCAPPDMRLPVFDGLIAGVVDEGQRFDCPLVGGNLSRAPECSLHVTVVGRVKRGHALRRDGLRAGDRLFVTGELGAATLARLRADATGGPLRRVPRPRIEAGLALARIPGVRALIDLSDGLASDLQQLLSSGGLGAEIDPARLPKPRGFDGACRALGLDPLSMQASGGEDYELLFGLPRNSPHADASRLTRRLRLPVSQIGQVVDTPGIRGLPAKAAGHHF